MGLNKRLISSEAAAAPVPVNTENFDMVAYSGDSTNDRQITSLSFQPDLLWVKARNSTYTHRLVNSIDTTKALSSTSTAAETTSGLDSFLSNGWQMDYTNEMNRSGRTYIAWCFKGGGAAVSNTDGSITSTVSANPDAGFSIVKYTGTGAAATIGHGLSSAPELIITKGLTTVTNWNTYSATLGATKYIALDSNAAQINTSAGAWNNTNPTSSVFSVGSGFSYPSGIAYCFHSVDGYQKIGSYTGGGTSDVTVTTNFQPRFIMTKRTDNTGNWIIFDSQRSTSATDFDNFLYPNLSDVEVPNIDAITTTSTGFIVTRDNAAPNFSDGTYIYLAIA